MLRRLILAAIAGWPLHRSLAQDEIPRPRYKVSAAQLYEAMARRFPLRLGVAGLFELQVSAPSLLLLPARNLLGATLVTDLSGVQLPQAGRGETDLGFALRYEPGDRTLRARHPQVLDLRWPGLPAQTRQGLLALMPSLSDGFGEVVLHQFTAGELGLPETMGFEPDEIKVQPDGIEILFRPKSPSPRVGMALGLAAALLCASAVAPAPVRAQPAPLAAAAVPASAQAKAVFDDYWERTASMFPEWATYRGDQRFGDRLNDGSPEARVRWFAFAREIKARLAAIPRQELAAQDRLSVDVLARRLEMSLAMEPYAGYETMTVDASPWPFQSAFQGLLQASPVATEAQARQVLARMAAYPARVDQEIAKLRAGMAQGWVPPRHVLEVALGQLDAQLARRGARSFYYEPFDRLGSGIPEATRAALRSEAATSVDSRVLPALQRLRDFVAGEYLARAPQEGGLARYPSGAQVYATLVRNQTTTSLTPEAIHAIGLEQVAKAQQGMDAVRREVGFTGDLPAFEHYLNSDARFFKRSGEEVLAGYRDIIKRTEPQLPRLFAQLPRAPVGVRAIPEFMGIGAVESYNGPSLDGTRAGWFNANALAYAVRPTWIMEAIALHEAVPGHHLQIARAAELGELPMFRRAQGFTAYSEGWGLYAETLGPELGLYQDPYSRFGFHTNQAWRAARLVVDTGIHAKGWTRQQAIDYMLAATGMERNRVEWEVDRYISQPGQALAYMIGQLKFIELREQARATLGPRFDVRRFHTVVIDNGQLPLDLLERVVDEWVQEQQKQ
ncbi:DUF885 domain-containing protein [Ramlibacter sp.]|uniref:DUF885 domain-containing protein n=1 Tax=Ramlibacter sp. TaxID=1917967 RepID=UPI002625253E|nr:DUF885 domain-containing protein [Ramlibacter sp.]MDB5953813.1 hypothetical protein [Ramlibacter sp.]